MKRNFLYAFLLIPVLLMTVFGSGCNEQQHQDTAEEKKQTYTCPMHPQIVQHEPGTCPICNMDLVPFDKNNTDPSLTLSAAQQALANITTMVVGENALSNQKRLNARLVTDPSQTAFISSRVAGRIENLYVKETGVTVKRGQPLYRIYSEELASLQQEYLVAAAQVKQFPDDEKFRQIEKAAKQKLLLYDQTENQITNLVNKKTSSPYIVYSATVSGVVSELNVSEGQYVAAGSQIMRIEDYDKLWVEADIYPAEASLVKKGQAMQVIIPGWENEPQQMKVEFINPSLQDGSQLMQLRGSIRNIDRRWQAGIQATVLLPVASKSDVLSLPVDAVIRDGKGSVVWVETAEGKFEPRMVKTGMENADIVEITEGLEAGEKVAVTGAYLLHSEYILKKGADPMSAHNH